MSQGNMSGIFTNAVESIKMGIEDYAQANPARALSAVRNFYAGVLLLGKEVLIRAAPLANADDIIGAKYTPVPDGTGGVTHVIEGYQTRSEEHTSELQSLMRTSYAVFCLKQKK